MGPTLKIGSKLGRFTLERNLGKGGMGVVFLAHDTLLNVKVALKVLNPPLSRSRGMERFRREVLLARRVSHPDICRIFDIHEEEGILFISMEYVEGCTLELLLEGKKVLPAKMAGEIVLSICKALPAAHRMGVVHRDLKPSNIIVRGRSSVSILDFGLAKALDLARITVTGALVGTAHYMSPEVMKGKTPTRRSDIYSLGVILYRCVTGHLPFPGEDVVEVKKSIESGDFVPPRQLNPELTKGIEDVITKAIDANPVKRYRNTTEFKDSLVKALEGLPDVPDVEYDFDISSNPWHGNIDKSIDEALVDKTYSDTKKTRFKDTTMLFSDMVGITPYFDEHGDIAGRRKIRKHDRLLLPLIDSHGGKVIKTIGDAIMACFESADNGVEAAMDMQRVLDDYNSRITKNDDKIRIRIGLHSGRSIFESNDVFGNTVNVAARISSKAQGEEILISSSTREMLERNRILANFHSHAKLKGKKDVFNLYSVAWGKLSEKDTFDEQHPELGSIEDIEVDTDVDRMEEEPTTVPEAVKPELPMWPTVPVSMGGDDPGLLAATLTKIRRPFLVRLQKALKDFRPAVLIVVAGIIAALAVGVVVSAVMSDDAADGSKNGLPQAASMKAPTPLQPDEQPSAMVNREKAKNVVKPDADDAAEDLIKLEKEIFIAMFRKGIGPDYSEELDTEYKRMQELSKQSRYSEAFVTGKRVLAIIAEVAIEKPGKHPPPREKQDSPSDVQKSSLLPELDNLVDSINASMLKKGVVSGDVPSFDREYRMMKKMKKQSLHSTAIAHGKRALNILKNTKIDRNFVMEKITRFNEVFDKSSADGTANEVWDLSKKIMKSFDAGQYRKANRLINRALKMMGSR